MEGLLIAAELERLDPAGDGSRGSWRFPDPSTFVLPVGQQTLWIRTQPPDPQLEVRTGQAGTGTTGTAFQQLLQSRAGGSLAAVEQLGLDRIIRLDFRAGQGFVTSKPVTLWVELTGRNCNVVLTDDAGRILGVQREVTSQHNRYRQLVPGVSYVPPPPHDKPDPRLLGAAGTARLLLGRPVRDLKSVADGFGPRLSAAVAEAAGFRPDQEVTEETLSALEAALQAVLIDPAGAATRAGAGAGVRETREQFEREKLLVRLRSVAKRRISLLNRRLADVSKLERAAAGARKLRDDAEILLAYRPVRPAVGDDVQLTDFEGNPVTITLSPRLDAVGTAEQLYSRARRHEQRHERALEMVPSMKQELAEAERALEELDTLGLQELRKRAESLGEHASGRYRASPGKRITGPHGFEILVGRNARENDVITFRTARSRDVWLHVQGYRGSHVLIRSGNRDVPFETVLFAAQLAAGHSQAADSDNVPVDYTLRKNVWRPKGGAAGAVHFANQKTVWVTPVTQAEPPKAEDG